MQQEVPRDLGAWRPVALAVAIAALVFWLSYCLYEHPPRIEANLSDETMRSLAMAGLAQVRASFSGRDVVLTGAIASPEQRSEATRVVTDVEGVRRVRNDLKLIEQPPAEAPPPYLEINARPDSVTLRGPVPSEARRQELVTLAHELYGSERVDDRLVVDPNVDDGSGPASAAAILSVLARASQHVEAQMEGDSLRLSGTVSSPEARRRVEDDAQAAAPRVRLFFSSIHVEPAPSDTPSSNRVD